MSAEVTKFVVEKSIEFHRTEGRMLREQAEAWVREFFGERCLGFEPGCEVCKRWAALDALFEEVARDKIMAHMREHYVLVSLPSGSHNQWENVPLPPPPPPRSSVQTNANYYQAAKIVKEASAMTLSVYLEPIHGGEADMSHKPTIEDLDALCKKLMGERRGEKDMCIVSQRDRLNALSQEMLVYHQSSGATLFRVDEKIPVSSEMGS